MLIDNQLDGAYKQLNRVNLVDEWIHSAHVRPSTCLMF